jgi:hypothetical protein
MRANDGLVDTPRFSAIPALIAQFVAAQLWEITRFLVNGVIDLFTWAFSLDLLRGDPNTPGDGALAPVADAISSIYENVLGRAWMVAAIVLAGIWGVWKALVQRRYTETAGALTLSVIFVLVALFFVNQPERTVGTASEWTSKMSLAFLSGVNRGTVDEPDRAKSEVADHLFKTLIYDPWIVLNVGGLRHCVDTDRRDDQGFPEPVSPNDARADVCRDHVHPGADGFGGYAERFLRYEPGSDARKREYKAIKDGRLPETEDDSAHAPVPQPGAADPNAGAEAKPAADPDQFRGYRVDKADAPAVDVQQQGGAFQRVAVSLVVFVGALGAVVLLGFLSLAVILVQVLALVLLAFAPVALVVGIFPGRGHDLFRSWLAKLGTAIVIKAIYSLVIAVVLAVSAALVASTGRLGFLFAFAIQTLFFWAIFVYRKQISGRLVAATVGEQPDGVRLPRPMGAYYGVRAALSPVRAIRDAGRRQRGEERDERRTRALEGFAAAVPARDRREKAGTDGGPGGGGGGAGGRGPGGGESPKPPPPRGPGGAGGNGGSSNGDRPAPRAPSGSDAPERPEAERAQQRHAGKAGAVRSNGRPHTRTEGGQAGVVGSQAGLRSTRDKVSSTDGGPHVPGDLRGRPATGWDEPGPGRKAAGVNPNGRAPESVVREHTLRSRAAEPGEPTPRERHEQTLRRIRAHIERERRSAVPAAGRPREEGR